MSFGSWEARYGADLTSPFAASAVAYMLVLEEMFGQDVVDALLPESEGGCCLCI
jgi:hypothetical protein